MRKVFILLFISLALLSCQKEENNRKTEYLYIKVIFNIVETSTSDTNSFAESTNSFLLL